MNFKEFFQKWIYNDEPDESVEDNDSEFQQDFQELEGKENYDAFVIVYKPTCFDDVKEICRHIKKGRVVIMNTEKTIAADKQRLIDFLAGVAMAKDGMIAKIYQNVFIVSPKNIGVIEE